MTDLDPLPSWNDGAAKQAILEFVRVTTNSSNPKYVAPDHRVATFDQDGTVWVEHPTYTQVVFAFERLAALAPQHPEWKTTEPFKTVLSGDMAAVAKLGLQGLLPIVAATHSGMSVDAFSTTVRDWMGTSKHPRWNRPYEDLVFLPMLEVMRYLRANGYKTYFVTGGGQVFVRAYADRVYGIPPAHVIGSAMETQFTAGEDGKAVLMKSARLVLNNDLSGKPEDIYLFLGGPPQAAFGNSNGDQAMLEYTQAGDGARLMALVLHDDADREYAYGPAQGLPATSFGSFDQALYDKAKAQGWSIISMKKDWKRLFMFEP